MPRYDIDVLKDDAYFFGRRSENHVTHVAKDRL